MKLDAKAEPNLVADLERAAAAMLIEVYTPIAAAADQLAQSTEALRAARAQIVQRAAQNMAAQVAEVANTLQARHRDLDAAAAEQARTAARLAASSSVPGRKSEAKKTAHHLARAIQDASDALQAKHTRTAAVTAAIADNEAAILAARSQQDAAAVEGAGVRAAAEIQAAALAECYQAALDAAAAAAVRGAHRKPSAQNNAQRLRARQV